MIFHWLGDDAVIGDEIGAGNDQNIRVKNWRSRRACFVAPEIRDAFDRGPGVPRAVRRSSLPSVQRA